MSALRFFKDIYTTFLLHAVAAHFNNGLVPVAIFFLLLAMFTGNAYFEHTVLHLETIALCMLPVSFFSGIRDWRSKYNGARAPIFYKKIGLTGLLFLLGGSAVGIRLGYPEVLFDRGVLASLYVGCLFGSLPVVALLGHYGGKLSNSAKKYN
jgi:hypothetical protein